MTESGLSDLSDCQNARTGRIEEVALRLKGRHLQSFSEAIRETESQLEAARRSRQTRMRLLRLARKHKLEHCLMRLKEAGYIIFSGCGRPQFYYEPNCTRWYYQGLKKSCQDLSQNRQDVETQSLDPIISNLKTLLEESRIVQEEPLKVSWTLRDLYLENVWIGDLEVRLNLEEFEVKVRNISADIDYRGGYHHPHVNSNGAICWNGYDDAARAYHRSGDFLALKDLIDNLLNTYNPDSPFIRLDDWENGFGTECYECGERWPEDDLLYVESTDGDLCPDCRTYCDECMTSVACRHFDDNWNMCVDCLEDKTDYCQECGNQFLMEDLVKNSTDEDEEQEYLCEDCLRKRKEKGELSDEDRNDAEGVLVPSVALPPNAE